MSDPAEHPEHDPRIPLSVQDSAELDAAFDDDELGRPAEEQRGVSGLVPLSTEPTRVATLLALLRLSNSEELSIQSGSQDAIQRAMANTARLSPASERAIDLFSDGDEPVEAVRLLNLLPEPGSYDADDRSARIERVLAAAGPMVLETDSGARAFRMAPPAASEVKRMRRIRFGDFVALAAVLLVGTTILFPQFFSVRTMAEEIRCAQNMQQAGLGFSLFANEHDGYLPSREASGEERQPSGGGQWWLVGSPANSHSANLFVLVRQDYVPLEALACPGNKRAVVDHDHTLDADWESQEQVSYSYQLFDGRPPRFSDPGVTLLLADRSPVVSRAMRGETVDATENSHNHRGRGQNLLLPDFSVYFAYSPEMQTRDGNDNIWIPRSSEGNPRRVRLTGSERPGPHDAFVGP